MKTNEQFFKDRLAMCETEGWLDLVEELTTISNQLQDVEAIGTMEDLCFTKGQLAVIRLVTSMEDAAKFSMEQSS
jgi:hypothetical protein